MTLTHDPLPEPVDLSVCDQEPIHQPGYIQPHGALIVLEEPHLIITHASNNLASLWGVSAQAVLNEPLTALFSVSEIAEFQNAMATESLDNNVVSLMSLDRLGQSICILAHRVDNHLYLECEVWDNPPTSPPVNMNLLLKDDLARLSKFKRLTPFFNAVSQLLKKATGFDRVMVYQFAQDGHGQVIAEARNENLEPFLGLRYPATDVPTQARALYLRNPIRLIPDVNYTPVAVQASESLVGHPPLDMSYCFLRSVSPIHIEYLQNMGVRASMSISLVVNNTLWGLIACHHMTPRYMAFEMRTLCEFLGQYISMQIEHLIEAENEDYQHRLKVRLRTLVDKMYVADTFMDGLKRASSELLELVQASGIAITYGGDLYLQGLTPSESDMRQLLDWLSDNAGSEVTIVNSLSTMHPQALQYVPHVSGLLGITLSKEERDYILWFRPEVVQTVNWAGDPGNVATYNPAEGRLSPRRSFELWKEKVRGTCQPWLPAEVDIALDFRKIILNIIFRRVEELNRLSKKLRESEERYQRALTASRDGVWEWNLKTDNIIWNDRAAAIHGYSLGERVTFSSRLFFNQIHPDDRPTVQQAFHQHFKGGTSTCEIEYRVLNRQGQYIYVSNKAIAQRDEFKEPILVTGTISDITARKTAEESLRESQVRSRKIVEASIIGILFATPEGAIVDANEAFLNMIGYSRQALDAGCIRWDELTPPQYAELDAQKWQEVIQTGQCAPYEKQYIHKEGYLIDVLIAAALISSAVPTTCIAYVIDITTQKKAEETLRTSEARFRALVNAIPQIAYSAEPNGHIDWYNDRWYVFSGLSPDDPNGQALITVLHPDDLQSYLETWQTAVEKQTIFQGEYRFWDATLQQWRWHLGQATPLRTEDGTILKWFGTFTDIEPIKQAKELAEESNRRKSQFLANMSHELRTPLNAVIGYSEMMLMGLAGEMSGKQQKYTQNIYMSAKHLLDMVNDILDLSKVESGHVSFHPVPINIQELVQELNDILMNLAKTQDIRMTFEVDPSLTVIHADPLRLKQVFFNLISNAIKFNKPQGHVKVRLRQSQDTDSGWMVVDVEDTGIGIPQDKIKNLFQEFYQVDSSKSRRFEGTGLGLALTKHLIDLQHGTITVQSTEGEGSCFSFKIPLNPVRFVQAETSSSA